MSDEALRQEQWDLAGLKDGGREETVRKRLHSKYDPWAEAKRQVADFQSASICVLFGAGLGYVVRLILDRGTDCVWFETDSRILRESLGTLDFRQDLREGRLRIFQEAVSEEILAELFRGRTIGEISFFSHRGFLTDSLSELLRKVEFFLNKKGVNAATLARFDSVWARNLCENLCVLYRGRPVRTLFGIHKNVPAVVIGAGPSLNDSMEDLVRVRRKAIVVCVDTALRILEQAGIDPDYVVTVDPQPVNRCYLEGYEGKALIVTEPTASRFALRLVDAERLRFFWSPFALARLLFDASGGAPGEIAFGGSVSTNAYDFARKLGCDPVYVIGQDLSFSDGQVHAKGAVLEERLNWKEARTFRREMHNQMQRTALPTVLIPAMHKPYEHTNEKLVIFYRWLERRFRRDVQEGMSVINATARGARFDGIPRGDLLQLLSRDDIGSASREENAGHAVDLALLVQGMEQVLSRLERTRIALSSATERWERVPQKRDEIIMEMEEFLRADMEILNVLGNATQGAVLKITEGAVGSGDALSLYQALQLAAERYAKWLGRSLRIMRARHSI